MRAEQARGEALARQLDSERAAAEEAARRAVIRRRQVDAATRVLEALPAVLDSADRSVAQARVELAAAEAQRASQNEELAGLRRDESALRERLQAITENVHGLELQIYEKKLHLSSLLERAGSELGLVEDVLVAEYGPEVAVPVDIRPGSDETVDGADVDTNGEPAAPREVATVAFDRERQQKRLAPGRAQAGPARPRQPAGARRVRRARAASQVPDRAAHRPDEHPPRPPHHHRGDRREDADDLPECVRGHARPRSAEVFPVLFPGGSGSIQLTDPDNMLTTGIEVSVRPAGKKIERLSLLSGGERSLAAVALLIAIFKARPSPFYIMDEVEAALDDANLGRLLTIFEDLRRSSQLIVITHQKRTMEIADALYGVSMRQDGVSAVVGQRVAQEQAS